MYYIYREINTLFCTADLRNNRSLVVTGAKKASIFFQNGLEHACSANTMKSEPHQIVIEREVTTNF